MLFDEADIDTSLPERYLSGNDLLIFMIHQLQKHKGLLCNVLNKKPVGTVNRRASWLERNAGSGFPNLIY